MIANRIGFELICELRRWKGQLGKLFLLIIGFSLLCALLSIAISTASLLFSKVPNWVEGHDYYSTIVRQHKNGQLAGVNKLTLQNVADTPSIEQVTWFSIRTMNLELSGNSLPRAKILLFDEAMIAMLGINIPTKTSNDLENGAWISQRFWHEQLGSKPDIVGKRFYNSRIKEGIVIRGVLPSKLDNIGSWSPDIWLPGRYLRYQAPFSNEVMVDKFLLAVPIYYGIARSNKPISETAITARLNSSNLSVPGMSMSEDGAALIVFNGINLNPVAKNLLLNQWQLLLMLLIALAVVLSTNTLTVYVSRYILFQNEYKLQRILGASTYQLMKGPILAGIVKFLIIILLSQLMIGLFQEGIESSHIYKLFANGQNFTVNISHLVASWSLIGLILATCIGLGSLGQRKDKLFSRAMLASRSFKQKVASQSVLVFQLGLALFALNIILSMYLDQWEKQSATHVNDQIITFDAQQNGKGLNIAGLLQGNLKGIQSNQVAASQYPFDTSFTQEVKDSRLPPGSVFSIRYVTENYFSSLGIKSTDLKTPWLSGAVINTAGAELFQLNKTNNSILGSNISIGLRKTKYPIVGFVDNVPHQGKASRALATIYLPIQANNIDPLSSISLYYKAQQQDQIEHDLKQWLSENMVNPKFTKAISLAEVISEKDSSSHYLMFFASLVVVILLLGIMVSLSYQLKARLHLDLHEYGVMLAVGAPNFSLFTRIASQLSIAFLLAIPTALFAQIMLNIWLSESSRISISFSPVISIMSTLIMFILLLLITQIRLLNLVKRPIYNILRSNQ